MTSAWNFLAGFGIAGGLIEVGVLLGRWLLDRAEREPDDVD